MNLEKQIISFINKAIQFIRRYFRNKYWTVLFLFVTWISFFDNNSLVRQMQRKYQIMKLNKEIAYYNKELSKTLIEEKALKHNDEYFEKFVRENYLLKRKDEELYIFTEAKN